MLKFLAMLSLNINLHEGDFIQIPISDLNMLAYQNNFTYEMKPQNANVIIYSFIFDDESRENNIIYQFGINYNWEVEE